MKKFTGVFLIVLIMTAFMCGCGGKPTKKTISKYLEKAAPEIMATIAPEGLYTMKIDYLSNMYSDEIANSEDYKQLMEKYSNLFSSSSITEEHLREGMKSAKFGKMMNYFDEQKRLVYSAGPVECLIPNLMLTLIEGLSEYALTVKKYDPETQSELFTLQYNIDIINNGEWWKTSYNEKTEKGFLETHYDRQGEEIEHIEVELNSAGLPTFVKAENCAYEPDFGVIGGSSGYTEQTYTYDEQNRPIKLEEVFLNELWGYRYKSIDSRNSEGMSVLYSIDNTPGTSVITEFFYNDETGETERVYTTYSPDGEITKQYHVFFDENENIVSYDTKETDRSGINQWVIRSYGSDETLLNEKIISGEFQDSSSSKIYSESGVLLKEEKTEQTDDGERSITTNYSETGEPLSQTVICEVQNGTARSEYVYSEDYNPDYRYINYCREIALMNTYADGWNWKLISEYCELKQNEETTLYYERYLNHPDHGDSIVLKEFDKGKCILHIEDSVKSGFRKEYNYQYGRTLEEHWELRSCSLVTDNPQYKDYVYLFAKAITDYDDGNHREAVYEGKTFWERPEDRIIGGIYTDARVEETGCNAQGITNYHSLYDIKMIRKKNDDIEMIKSQVFNELAIQSFDGSGNPLEYMKEEVYDGIFRREWTNRSDDGNIWVYRLSNVRDDFIQLEKQLTNSQDFFVEFGEKTVIQEINEQKNPAGDIISRYVVYYVPDTENMNISTRELYSFYEFFDGGFLTEKSEQNEITKEKIRFVYRKGTDILLAKEFEGETEDKRYYIYYLDEFRLERRPNKNGELTDEYCYYKDKLVYSEVGRYIDHYIYDKKFDVLMAHGRRQHAESGDIYDIEDWYYDNSGRLIAYNDGTLLHMYDESGIEVRIFEYNGKYRSPSQGIVGFHKLDGTTIVDDVWFPYDYEHEYWDDYRMRIYELLQGESCGYS